MKKWALIAIMAFTLCSCGTDPQSGTNGTVDVPKTEVNTEVSQTEQDTTLELPILDEIDSKTEVGTAGSSLKAVPIAVELLDWGTTTGLDPDEIREATLVWMQNKTSDEQAAFMEKIELIDATYQILLGDEAEEFLDMAGCKNTAYPWSETPVESIEAIMEAVGLRSDAEK